MTSRTRNRLMYWALAIVPLSGLWVLGQAYGPGWFTFYLCFYIFIYRPTLDTQRLLSLGVIEEKDAWRFFVPLAVDTLRYTRALWLG